MRSQLFATKPLQLLLDEMAGEHRLRRVLGPVSLTALGVGAIIGTGIFVLTGIAAHDKTGPALMLSFVVTGVRESAGFNAGIVLFKLIVVGFVIVVGAFHVDPANWHPFAPYGLTGISFFGKTLFGQTGVAGEPLGMLSGAAIIFFAYIGFDSVSTHSEEARNPQRDVPIGIIVSLVLCTVLYIAVAAVLTGMVPYDQINIDAPVSDAFRQAGLPWARF